jgi:hypothetical protein
MMGHREPMKSGDEYDALTRRGKRVHRWRPGQRRSVKRKFSKRIRREAKREATP